MRSVTVIPQAFDVEAAYAVGWFEEIAETNCCLGTAQDKIAIRLKLAGYSLEYVHFRFRIEIDEDIPAVDDIERPKALKALEQIELAKVDHGAERRIDLPRTSAISLLQLP